MAYGFRRRVQGAGFREEKQGKRERSREREAEAGFREEKRFQGGEAGAGVHACNTCIVIRRHTPSYPGMEWEWVEDGEREQ